MKLRLIKTTDEGNDVWSYYFEATEQITWIVGQSIRLELPRPTWGVSERRFTIASSPHEKHIRITTRLSGSDFKQALRDLKKGDVINGYAIEGDFVWGKENRHRLFVAGGIGITPFRAMLAERIASKKPANASLLYSSSTHPVIFKVELDAWQTKDNSLELYYLVGQRIALEKESSLAPLWLESLVYISGSSQMVDSLSEQFLNHGLPKEQLRLDWFTGNVEG